MKSNRIDISEFSPFNKIVGDFLNQEPEISSFGPPLYSLESATQNIESRKSFPVNRTILSSVIRDQYEQSGIDLSVEEKLSSQIDLLKHENTYTVTTGHQLCIFTGPLYFPIKVIQVIKMADELNKSLIEGHVVPIFWLASEDHDFAEVNHAHLFNRTIEWEDVQGGMVGDYSCESLSGVLESLNEILGDSENSTKLKDLFNQAYNGGKTLAEATRILLHQLFGDRGLVILDGNSAELKKLFTPYLKKEVENRETYSAVSNTNSILSKNYKIQVNPRAINLFYLTPNNRKRIDIRENEFYEDGGSKKWKLPELLDEIDSNPERFSPNVILRPLYQEVILPNIAYVGGPGELAYWLQLKMAFESFSVPYPLLSLRNNFMWLDKGKIVKLDKLNLTYKDLFSDESQVIEKLVNYEEDAHEVESETAAVKESFDKMADKLTDIDPSLKAYVLAEARKTEKQLEQLKKRLIRAKKDKNKVQLESYWKLIEKVFPKGNLHERYDNFVPYYLKHGSGFFNVLYNELNPLDPRLCVILE